MPKAIKRFRGKQGLEEGKETAFIAVDDRIPSLRLLFSAFSVGLSALCLNIYLHGRQKSEVVICLLLRQMNTKRCFSISKFLLMHLKHDLDVPGAGPM